MRAEILAIGSELLAPGRIETNAGEITQALLEIGIDVVARSVVADDVAAVTAAFATALRRAEVVISTGGLGPTADDLTREAAAAALGRKLYRDPQALRDLEERFARFGRVMAKVNAQQADVIEGGRLLQNANGSAPGQWLEHGDRIVVLLPGPPQEMRPMVLEQVIPPLRARGGSRVLRRRIMRIASMGESDAEQVLAPIYKTYDNPRTTILGGAGQVELQLVADGDTPAAAEERLESLAGALRAALPDRFYSEDGQELPEVVGALLLANRATLAVAESCTGGLIAKRLTDVPGSSAWFERGFVTYSNASKSEMLGVDAGLIASAGAVSEAVAEAMASGARKRARTTFALSVTGIAGPDGGSDDKPVGLTFLALAGPRATRTRKVRFIGDRIRVRRQASQAALEMLRRTLLGLAPW